MSTLTLRNDTNEAVRLAIYRAPQLNHGLGTIAWRIAEPPPGGTQEISLPADFGIYARYSGDPSNPSHLDAETRHLSFAETTARFVIRSVEAADSRAAVATIEQVFDDLVLNEVRVANHFGLGCLTSITQDGDPIFAPQVIWPGGVLIEDIRAGMYVSVVGQFVSKGDRLVQEEISTTQIEALPSSTITVTGSMWTGYALRLG